MSDKSVSVGIASAPKNASKKEEHQQMSHVTVGCYVDGASTTLLLFVNTTLIMKLLKASNCTCSDCITNMSPL